MEFTTDGTEVTEEKTKKFQIDFLLFFTLRSLCPLW
jgi:hypothetical protein